MKANLARNIYAILVEHDKWNMTYKEAFALEKGINKGSFPQIKLGKNCQSV